MMQATTKRYEEPRESGGEVKGVVLILICYFYGILLFLFFGTVTKLGQFVFNRMKEQIKKMQFWDVKEECKPSQTRESLENEFVESLEKLNLSINLPTIK